MSQLQNMGICARYTVHVGTLPPNDCIIISYIIVYHKITTCSIITYKLYYTVHKSMFIEIALYDMKILYLLPCWKIGAIFYF